MQVTPYTSIQSDTDFGLTVSNLKYSASLAASTDTSLTVPGKAPRYKAVIKVEAAAQVWLALNEAAAAPAGNSFAESTSEMIPVGFVMCREVKAGDVLHFITSAADVDVSVSLYSV